MISSRKFDLDDVDMGKKAEKLKDGDSGVGGFSSNDEPYKYYIELYAQSKLGNTYDFVEDSWEGSIFNTVEYPALKNNQNINNVFTELFKNGGN